MGQKLWKVIHGETTKEKKHLGGRDGEDVFKERNLGENLGNEIQGRENMG